MNRRSPAPKAGALNQISLRPGISNNGRDGWDRTIIPGSKAPCPAVGPHPCISWSGRPDSNRRSPAPEAGTINQTSLRPGYCKMVPASGFKPASSGYRPDALSAELHGQKWERQGESNSRSMVMSHLYFRCTTPQYCNDNPAFVAKCNDKCSDNTIAFFTAKKCKKITLFTTNKDIGADDGNRTR